MAKQIGADRFGDFYTDGKVRKRREWRGVSDTLYDYGRWLGILMTLGKFIVKPRNIKAMFRYRWMANYLAVPMMVDRHTQGLRGEYLRICHIEQDLIIEDVAKLLDGLFRGDRRIGNDKEFSKKVVLVDENEMTAVMMGFPTLKGLSRETVSTYIPVLLNQHAVEHYIDVAQQFGLAGDVCPMPEAEVGVSIDDDAPVLGACAVQCNTTCDGSLLGNGVISKRLELEDGVPVFQLATPLRHREDDVQEYAAQEVRNAIAFIEKEYGEKYDWDALFERAKQMNEQNTIELEKWDIFKTPYSALCGIAETLYRLYSWASVNGQEDYFTKVDRKVIKIMRRCYKKKYEPFGGKTRHRAFLWGPSAVYYTDFPTWIQNCWGVNIVLNMDSTMGHNMISMDDPEQAIKDLALFSEKAVMRHHAVGGWDNVNAIWDWAKNFNCDMVLMNDNVACKGMNGVHAMMEEQARDLGFYFIFVEHDLEDCRTISRRDMRKIVNNYMSVVVGEEPLDPTLVDFDDSEAW